MPLNTSGAISLAGSTAGQSIALELGLSASGNISLNQANVRSLAGVPSGAITMPTNFYGKSAQTFYSTGITMQYFYDNFSYISRFNACGSLIGNSSVAAISIWTASSGTSSNVGVFYACGFYGSTAVARINGSGALVGSLTNVGTARGGQAGSRAGANLLVWGGYTNTYCGCCTITTVYPTVTRINGSGALVGSEGSVPDASYVCLYSSFAAATSTSSNVIFYGYSNRVTRINACGTRVGSVTNVGCAGITRSWNAGSQAGADACGVGGVAIFYGGRNACGILRFNCVTRINSCGTLVGSITNVGTGRYKLTGMPIGSVAFFYGGCGGCGGCRLVTRLNACGALVGSQTTASGAYGFFNVGSSASVV